MDLYLNNVRIQKIQRYGAMDRYGRYTLKTIYSRIRGRLDKSTTQIKNLDGSFFVVDATLMLSKRYELQPKDIIVFDTVNKEEYQVFKIVEHADIAGTLLFRTFYLTKKAE